MNKYIKEFIKQIFYEFIYTKKNINHQLLEEVNSETAQYIRENMSETISVKSKFTVLDIAISHVSIKNGKFLEFGVFTGGTINYIASKIPNSTIFGFDSFEGLPEDWRNGFKKGKFNLYKKLPNVQRNVILYPGWFDESIPQFIEEFKDIDFLISFIHLDCDLYSSSKEIFSLLSEKIGSGTVIVFDEYFNYIGWQKGEFLAFREFINSKNLNYEYLAYNSLHEQVAIKII